MQQKIGRRIALRKLERRTGQSSERKRLARKMIGKRMARKRIAKRTSWNWDWRKRNPRHCRLRYLPDNLLPGVRSRCR